MKGKLVRDMFLDKDKENDKDIDKDQKIETAGNTVYTYSQLLSRDKLMRGEIVYTFKLLLPAII